VQKKPFPDSIIGAGSLADAEPDPENDAAMAKIAHPASHKRFFHKGSYTDASKLRHPLDIRYKAFSQSLFD
jgi:hypothetical protein